VFRIISVKRLAIDLAHCKNAINTEVFKKFTSVRNSSYEINIALLTSNQIVKSFKNFIL
jgi:hypothetical protein